MISKIKADNLKLTARRRDWVPGRFAVWVFRLGLFDVWPLGDIIWEKR